MKDDKGEMIIEANINEIKYYCPNIMSALPEQIAKIAEELYLL